jgi:restriction system protein
MNDVSLPTVSGLRALVIRAVEDSGRVASTNEIRSRVGHLGAFTPAQLARAHGPGPGTELDYRIRWTLVDLRRSGAIVRQAPRVWALSANATPSPEE